MRNARLTTTLSITLLILLLPCGCQDEPQDSPAAARDDPSASQKVEEVPGDEESRLEEGTIPEIEDRIVEAILRDGIGDRLVIKSIAAPGAGTSSRLTLRERPDNPESFSMDASEQEGDGFPYLLGGGAEIRGLNSIHRYAGTIHIWEHVFTGEGDERNRLTFLLTKQGYVYVRGKGTVQLPDGEIIKLGE